MTTRGLSLLNPCNLMHSEAFTWDGEVVPSADPEGRLCQFSSFVMGIRAAAELLKNYYQKHGCDTVRKIITRYAPNIENPTDSYTDFIADWCAVKPDEALIVTDPSIMYALISGIIHFEQGVDFCTTFQMQQGISLVLPALA